MKPGSALFLIVDSLRNYGLLFTLRRIWEALNPLRKRHFRPYLKALKDKQGLEIGGASPIFLKGELLPVYSIIKALDVCNLKEKMFREKKKNEKKWENFTKLISRGRYFSLDATDLRNIPDGTYDFVMASHVIEHIANPIKALKEWMRVLRKGGYLFLIVPQKDGMFDRRRETTSLSHLIEDYETDKGEDDLTHLEDVLNHHDFSLDPGVSGKKELKERSLRNVENRMLHHHVFTSRSLCEFLNFLNLKIHRKYFIFPCHMVVLCSHIGEEKQVNKEFLPAPKE
ncbi:MAG: class I SAM-dependent methyltransferase [Candidatus Aminicenantes bacterium]|nr:class I SAM-dependent methyltransferase [Candidatus Aminicenantes bacterium]